MPCLAEAVNAPKLPVYELAGVYGKMLKRAPTQEKYAEWWCRAMATASVLFGHDEVILQQFAAALPSRVFA